MPIMTGYIGKLFRLVAQLDRASGFEPEGREFESLRARGFIYRLEISDLALRSAGFRTPDAAAGGREFDSLASLRAKLDDAREARVGPERQRGTSGRGPRAISSGAHSKPNRQTACVRTL